MFRTLIPLLALSVSTLAFADPDEEIDLLSDDAPEVADPTQLGMSAGPEDETEEEAVIQATPAADPTKGPGPLSLDVAMADPFQDTFPLTVTAVEKDAVVVELPIFVGRSKFDVEKPFSIKAEIFLGETPVGVTTTEVVEASIADLGPSFVFIRYFVAVNDKVGEISMKISKDGEELFTTSTRYAL